MTLKASIAGCMTGVTASNTVNLVVADGTTTTSALSLRKKRVATTDSIIAEYVVCIADPTSGVTYDTLVTELDAAVSCSTFTTLLTTYSAVYSIPGYSSMTSSTIDSTADSNSSSGSSKKKDGLSGGAIAGIVIACVVAAALCIGLAVFYFTRMGGEQSDGDDKASTGADEVQVEVEMTKESAPPSSSVVPTNDETYSFIE